MSKDGFSRFLEYEAGRKPLKVKGRIDKDELMREAKLLADRISGDNTGLIGKYWEEKNYWLVAFLLKKYGLEFKGITYTEELIRQFQRIIAERKGLSEARE